MTQTAIRTTYADRQYEISFDGGRLFSCDGAQHGTEEAQEIVVVQEVPQPDHNEQKAWQYCEGCCPVFVATAIKQS